MIVGGTIGRVTVLRQAEPVRFGRILAKRVSVRCVCGAEWVALESNVTAGESYGCRDRACRKRWKATRLVAETDREIVHLGTEAIVIGNGPIRRGPR